MIYRSHKITQEAPSPPHIRNVHGYFQNFRINRPRLQVVASHVALSRSLEKEPNNKHLQPSHTHHHQTLNNTKVEDPPLRTPNSTEISVLTGTEVFLVTGDSRELSREFEYRLFKGRGLLWGSALFSWNGCAGFVFDLVIGKGILVPCPITKKLHCVEVNKAYRDLEIYKLLCESTHLVVEAKAVLSSLRSREHKVALSLLLPIHNDLIIWSYHLVIYIE
jgi:hypothetical protein